MTPDPLSLEPTASQMEDTGAAALAFAVRFVADRASAPASDLEGAYELAAMLRRPPPDQGGTLAASLEVLEQAAGKALDAAGPGYLAFIPGGGLWSAAVADFLACVTNRFVNLSAPAPALVQLEANVVRWLCDVFDFPEGSQGILTSGGSIANLSAIVTARHFLLADDFAAGTLYVSDQGHHSIAKAARIAGFPRPHVRVVPTTSDLMMDMEALHHLVVGDRARGLVPFMVVGNAGTTNTGAVDPLEAIAAFCAEQALWFHADAAYGGFFRLTERGRGALAGIDGADSITLDPHKGMFLPYGTGGLIVRDGERLRDAHAGDAHYLQDLASDPDIPNFSDYSPELSRDFRGLRVWLPLELHGVSAFRDALDEKLDLAELVYDALAEVEGLELPWRPVLSTVAFRPRDPHPDAPRRLLEAINASRRVYLSSTVIDGRVFLRISVLSVRTHRDRIEEAIDIVTKATATL